MKRINFKVVKHFGLNISWPTLWPLLVLFLISGCLAGSYSSFQNDCGELPEIDNGGRVSVFLNLERADVQHVTIAVSSLEVLAGDSWLPVSETALELDTERISKGQVFLGSRVIPPGIYKRFRVTVSEAYKVIRAKKLDLNIGAPVVEVVLPTPVEIGSQTSAVVLLSWDAESVFTADGLTPIELKASHSQTNHVVSNKAYVSCPEINNVYVVRTDKNWVQGAFYVSGRPTYMSADTANKKLYILTEEEAKIKIVDMVSLLVTEEIKIPMTRKPIFMTMMPDHTSAIIIDDMGSLVKMDLQNGLMLARARIGERPVYAAYLASQDRLVVSSSMDSRLYFIKPAALEVVDTIDVAGSPNGVLEWGKYLYVAESGVDRVSFYDLNERRVVKSIPVGYSPSRLVSFEDSIYLANKLDSSVFILKGGQFFVNKIIPVTGSPGELAVAENHRLLYVGNGECDGNLAVIDITSNSLIGKVELGAKPGGLAVIQ